MCDTILAPPSSTAGGVMLFGKNSDRQRNEAQAVENYPRADHEPGSQLTCTYVTIPQVAHTHAILICRPFWMWGAEMGANEHGVVIGNEGLIARGPAPEKEALTGMDLLRLGLERASSAAEAVEVITTLLERHGQGGNCGHLKPSYYNNGFMIADTQEAYVLETVGSEWLLDKVRDVHAISNAYSIGRQPLRMSGGLRQLVQDSGWSDELDPNYAAVIESSATYHIETSGARRTHSTSLLRSRAGRLGVADMMSVLRDHGFLDQGGVEWGPECLVKPTLCMHAGAADRGAQTVGSMVTELRPGRSVHWVTGTAAPCTAIFRPLLIDVPIPSVGPPPKDKFDPRTLWWEHERLHRAAVAGDFTAFVAGIRVERDALEVDFQARVTQVLNGGTKLDCERVISACWQEAMEMERGWRARVSADPLTADMPHVIEWERMNRLASIDFL